MIPNCSFLFLICGNSVVLHFKCILFFPLHFIRMQPSTTTRCSRSKQFLSTNSQPNATRQDLEIFCLCPDEREENIPHTHLGGYVLRNVFTVRMWLFLITGLLFFAKLRAPDGAESSSIICNSNQNMQITARKAVDFQSNLETNTTTHPGRTCQPGSGSCG